MKRYLVSLLLICLSTILLSAETQHLSGTVIDSTSQRGIPNVNIIVKDSDIGTITNQDGDFTLLLSKDRQDIELVISHIAYEHKTVSLREFRRNPRIALVKNTIEMDEVQVEAQRKKFHYFLPESGVMDHISSDQFDAKGYVDAADILAPDQSTAIEEDLSGRKTISVRASNAYEVTILYDGVRINNNFNKIFDLSLIDPSNLEQIDIIKGYNSAEFGYFGSSAVINFIPRTQQDYLLKFQQRIGSYDSGDWDLNFYKKIFGVNVFSSYKRSGSTMTYTETSDTENNIIHDHTNYAVGLSYDFGRKIDEDEQHQLQVRYLNSDRRYDNVRYDENTNSLFDIYTFKYRGNPLGIGTMRVTTALQNLNEKHIWKYGIETSTRHIIDNTMQFNLEQSLDLNLFLLYMTYQFDGSELDYNNKKEIVDYKIISQNDQYFERFRNGLSTSLLFNNDKKDLLFGVKNLGFILSYEWIQDHFPAETAILYSDNGPVQKWHESSYFFTISFGGLINNVPLDGYFSYGLNYTIPNLYQQILSTFYRMPGFIMDKLLAENKKTLEIGWSVETSQSIHNFAIELNGAIFHNSYQNKFREIFVSGSPYTFFDNHSSTDIAGIESSVVFHFFQRRLSLNGSVAKYKIADLVAFPFKPDQKVTLGATLSLKNFSIDLLWFQESERIGRYVTKNRTPAELKLGDFNNVDIHIRKSFRVWRTLTTASFSGRNIFSNEPILEGIALRDRRLYFTLAFQFE